MRGMTQMIRSRAARLAGPIALGLGLLTLGALALLALGLALPVGSALAGKHGNDNDWDWDSDRTDRARVEGQTFHWNQRMAPGRTLEIRGINGSIEAEIAPSAMAEVEARKTGRKSDPDGVKIEVVERRDGILICARYPRPDGELNDCEGDHQEVRNNDVTVRFKVRVPAGVRLVSRTVNGGIDIRDLKSDVEATTVNGGIHVWTTGVASATTVNGSDLDDDLEFVSVNGRVLVEMPGNVNAEVRGSTVHGSIATDFPLQLQIRGRGYGSRRVGGTIGRGGHQLRLETVNGSIELRSLGSSRDSRRSGEDREDGDDEDGDDGDDGL